MAFYSFGLWNMLGLGGRAIELKTQIDEYNQNREILETLNEVVNESKTKNTHHSHLKEILKILLMAPQERVYIPVRAWQTTGRIKIGPQEAAADMGLENEYRRAVDESNVYQPIGPQMLKREYLSFRR